MSLGSGPPAACRWWQIVDGFFDMRYSTDGQAEVSLIPEEAWLRCLFSQIGRHVQGNRVQLCSKNWQCGCSLMMRENGVRLVNDYGKQMMMVMTIEYWKMCWKMLRGGGVQCKRCFQEENKDFDLITKNVLAFKHSKVTNGLKKYDFLGISDLNEQKLLFLHIIYISLMVATQTCACVSEMPPQRRCESVQGMLWRRCESVHVMLWRRCESV